MKKLALVFLGLLLATQAYAFGKNERNALLGFGAGILVAHIIDKHQNVSYQDHSRVNYGQRVVYSQPQHVVYEREPQRKHHRKEHKMRKHAHRDHRGHRDVVVVNHYRDHYYY